VEQSNPKKDCDRVTLLLGVLVRVVVPVHKGEAVCVIDAVTELVAVMLGVIVLEPETLSEPIPVVLKEEELVALHKWLPVPLLDVVPDELAVSVVLLETVALLPVD
jgi:hypothetical protein